MLVECLFPSQPSDRIVLAENLINLITFVDICRVFVLIMVLLDIDFIPSPDVQRGNVFFGSQRYGCRAN